MRRWFAFPYDDVTGRILKRDTCRAHEVVWYDSNTTVFTDDQRASNWDDGTHWVQDGALVERPLMPLVLDRSVVTADGVDTATVTGIPPGTVVRMDGQPDEVVDDGVLEFAAALPGQYTLRLRCFPYRDAEVSITAE